MNQAAVDNEADLDGVGGECHDVGEGAHCRQRRDNSTVISPSTHSSSVVLVERHERSLITQLIHLDSHRRFAHHRWPSSGTVSSLLARWRGEQTVTHVT